MIWYGIAVKFGKHLCNYIAEVSAKFHSNPKTQKQLNFNGK